MPAWLPALTAIRVPRTVLLLNRSEVQSEFLSIAEKLSSTEPPRHATLVLLLEHLYQVTFGTRCDLGSLHHLLKVGKAFPFSSQVWALVLYPQLERGRALLMGNAARNLI